MVKKEFIIIRHRKENLEKCSLKGFEKDPRFAFYTYPNDIALFDSLFFEPLLVLDVEGEELSQEKNDLIKRPILLIDATWRYAQAMIKNIPSIKTANRCRLPDGWKTAYPRKQDDCPDPSKGLASIEALYIAAYLTNKNYQDLLSTYYWRTLFLERNRDQLESMKNNHTHFTGAEALHDF